MARLDADDGGPRAAGCRDRRADFDADAEPSYRRSRTARTTIAAVERAKEEIRAGEAFQVVVSQRFEMPHRRPSALDVYRVLRATNPSPYMYLFRFDGFDVVGSSPEALVKVTDGRAHAAPDRGHPAGAARPRRRTPALAAELLADAKERAEHLMLVDLGRNDLGRVCAAGSVEVVDFMSVERYSHVMHIVVDRRRAASPRAHAPSTCSRACFPAGTLSGAPEAARDGDHRGARADPARRSTAAASATSTSPATSTPRSRSAPRCCATASRTSRPAAGIVADSDPAAEDTECRNKAMAVLRAVATAGALRPARPPS